MSLTDQEQVILKAIDRVRRGDVALISDVIKAVGYPKATTKKVLLRLNDKGVIALHRHDWPRSLKPEQRKLMVRIKGDYFNAVSMRKRNPQSKGKSALRKTGKALKSAARGLLASGSEILGAGASALNPVRRRVRNKYIDLVIKGQAKKTPDGWRVGKKTFAQGRGTVNVASGYYLDRATGTVYAKRERNKTKKKTRKRNAEHKDSDHPVEVTKHWRSGPPGYLTPWQRAHHAGQSQLFETGIKPAKRRNAVVTPVIARQMGEAHAKAGKKLTPYDAREADKVLLAAAKAQDPKRPAKKYAELRDAFNKGWEKAYFASVSNPRKKSKGKKHASRSLHPSRKKTGRARASSKARNRSGHKSVAKTRKTTTKRITRNPSAESIRKEFAGSVSGSKDLFFPQGTPQGLAKLGKLVSITTEEGTIKPVHGAAWLCADTKGKLHIGSVTGAPLFDGPARSFGHVTKLEYESSKPHLGYKGPIIWFHHAGEENGIRPTLKADGKGGLVFKGGDYRLTRRGIEN